MHVLLAPLQRNASFGKQWEVQMPPCNATLCPVTSPTLISILQNRDEHLTEAAR